jgi:hypothetical protein
VVDHQQRRRLPVERRELDQKARALQRKVERRVARDPQESEVVLIICDVLTLIL